METNLTPADRPEPTEADRRQAQKIADGLPVAFRWSQEPLVERVTAALAQARREGAEDLAETRLRLQYRAEENGRLRAEVEGLRAALREVRRQQLEADCAVTCYRCQIREPLERGDTTVAPWMHQSSDGRWYPCAAARLRGAARTEE